MGGLVQPGGGNEDCLEVCFVGLVVGRNYVWCLVIVVIFMGFGGAKRWGKALKSSFGVIVSVTGYCKLFYRILPFFPILFLFYLF